MNKPGYSLTAQDKRLLEVLATMSHYPQMNDVEYNLDGSKVDFLGEGNAHIVVSVKERGFILRFPKSKFTEKCHSDKLYNNACFSNNVMIDHLGHDYLQTIILVRIPPQQFEAMKAKIQEHRKPHRLEKNIHFPMALSMPNYTLPLPCLLPHTEGPTLAIEIKPKSGYRFSKNCPHPSLCNYCLKQFYKLKIGAIKEISGYCPLELYSGDKSRMRVAIQALMKDPQNNFRLFRDGEVLHSTETAETERVNDFITEMFVPDVELKEILIKILLKESNNLPVYHDYKYPKSTENKRPMRLVCDSTTDDLPDGSILSKVLEVQQLNEISDIEAKEVLDKLLAMGETVDSIHSRMYFSDSVANSLKETSEETRPGMIGLLVRYMMATTANDLSFIITIRKAKESSISNPPPEKLSVLVVDNITYYYTIRIIDVDLKRIPRIAKQIANKQSWINAFTELNCWPQQ